MKPIRQFIILAFAIIISLVSAHAQTPGEQFTQMVGQLQQSPSDRALREKIIKLALELNPAPVMPEEVQRRMARGEAAIESAKDVSGFTDAAREFQTAANAAPWYANAYFNLGVAQEKSDQPKAAMESFRLYLLAAPDGKDAADVKKRIYKLEYAAEQAATKKAEDEKARIEMAAKEQEAAKAAAAAEERKKNSIEGAWVNETAPDMMPLFVIERVGKALVVKAPKGSDSFYSSVKLTETSVSLANHWAASQPPSYLNLKLQDGALVGTGRQTGSAPMRLIRKP